MKRPRARYASPAAVRALADAARDVLGGPPAGVVFGADGSVTFLDARAAPVAPSPTTDEEAGPDDALAAWERGE